MSSAANYYGAAAVPPTTAYGPPKLFVYMVLGAINFKTLNRMIIPGGIEYGFFQRVSQIAYCGSMN
jgi:hypothetical protein